MPLIALLAPLLAATLASLAAGQASAVEVPAAEVSGAEVTHVARAWTQHEGLPGGGIQGFTLAPSGHLWIAAYNGLARFDGREFEAFELANHPELFSIRCRSLLADETGSIWVGTQGGGLAYYDCLQERFLPEPPALGLGMGQTVRALARGPQGSLWAGVFREVWRWSGVAGESFVRLEDEELEGVRYEFATSPEGVLWLVGKGSVLRVEDRQLVPMEVPRELTTPPQFVTATSRGLWVGLENSLLRWDGQSWHSQKHVSRGAYRTIVEDAQGQHWALRKDNRLWRMPPGSNEFQLQELWEPRMGSTGVFPSIPLTDLCVDDQGVLWAVGDMLLRIQASEADYTLPMPLDDPQAWASVQDGSGAIWSVGNRGGLYRWDLESGGVQALFMPDTDRALPKRAVGLFCDRDDRLWVGMGAGGIVTLDTRAISNWTWAVHSGAKAFDLGDVRAFHQDASGAIWAGGSNGLLRLQGDEAGYWGKDQGIREVHAIESSPDGTVWVGMAGGLSSIRGNEPARYTHDSHAGLPQGAIRSLRSGAGGVLWIGSTGGGLGRLDDGGLKHFTRDTDGLPENVVSGIFELGEELWFFGNQGLHALHLEELRREPGGSRLDVRSFGYEVGIDEGNGGFCPAGFVGLEGALWIPTGRGLTRFDPHRERNSPSKPQVTIERLTFGDEFAAESDFDELMELGVGVGDLRVEFSAVSLAQPEQLRYEYRMSGVDDGWVSVDTVTQVRFAHLAPGTYEFQVRARLQGGYSPVVGPAASLRFRIREPFWAQPSFFVPVGLLIFGFLSWWIQRLMRSSRAERARREQARKMEALGALAGGIAHDLNNVLTPIFGYTELAKERLPELAPERDMLDNVLRAAERARRLVEGVLNFGRRRPNLSPVQLGEILEETCTLLRPTQPGVTFRVEVDDRIGPIMGDPTQLHQVVYNLCTNAVQAMESKGKLELTLSESLVDASMARQLGGIQPGPYVCLMVRDDGPGMPPAVVQRIFEPFFTTKAPGSGTGMGLAVVHGIVTAHDGALRLESQVGRGSTFRIYLPLSESQRTEELPKTPQFRGNRPAPSTREKRGEHILIVDDEPVLVNVVSSMLSEAGYRVTGFIDTEEALRNIKDLLPPVSLAILDQDMPVMKGLELAARLKESRPDLPIILATGMPQSLTPADRLSPHIAHIVYKPFTAGDIVQVVDEQLGGGNKAQVGSRGASQGD